MILPFILHHANRAIKEVAWGVTEFYAIKDQLLKSGRHINYDIQKIDGKRCNTCDRGVYTGYYSMSGEKWTDSCNRCNGSGWYHLPKWICLSRIKYGRYYFHRPLKREVCVKNPFTKENMGWVVSDRPVISGYIDHNMSVFGRPALLILFYIYNREIYIKCREEIIAQIRSEWRWRVYGWRKRVVHLFIPRTKIYILPLDEAGNVEDQLF
jgi:hypothetical protein